MPQSPSQPPGRPARMQQMVAELGINLRAATETGILSAGTLARMQARCQGCPEPRLCDLFLERHEDGAEAAPGYCPNAAALTALRAQFGPVGEGWPDRAPRQATRISRERR